MSWIERKGDVVPFRGGVRTRWLTVESAAQRNPVGTLTAVALQSCAKGICCGAHRSVRECEDMSLLVYGYVTDRDV